VNPKDDKKQSALNTPINAPLPYEFQFTTTQTAQTPYTPQYSIPQYSTPQPQAQQQKQKEKELNKIRWKALIGAVLLFIPIINLIGIGLLVDALIHYLKLRSRS
jgi:hypothetical protein